MLALALLLASPAAAQDADDLYRYRADERTHWVSPENPTGAKGAGAKENKGAKGHAFETIAIGRSHVLADIKGAGTIDRMWMTIEDRSPEALRGLRLDIELAEQGRPAELQFPSANDCAHAMAGDRLKAFGPRDREIPLVGALDDALGDRVL